MREWKRYLEEGNSRRGRERVREVARGGKQQEEEKRGGGESG